MRTGGEHSVGAADGERLLDLARDEARRGSLERAWRACVEAARVGRAHGDARMVAMAAVAVTEPDLLQWQSGSARQALCLEALGMLGPQLPDEPAETTSLRVRVQTHLDTLSIGWSVPLLPTERLDPAAAEHHFEALRAEHRRSISPLHAAHRIELGAQAIAVGLAAPDPSWVAWGRMWRLDALQQLGLRLPMQAEIVELAAVVASMESPVWRWRLALVHANVALLEHRLDDARSLAADAHDRGSAAGAPESDLLDLILRTEIADRSGDGLDEVEIEIRHAVASMPLFAQGWRARVLLRLGREDEALAIWRLLAPHIEQMPELTHEWLVAAVGHVELAQAAGDRAASARLGEMLTPYAHLHVAAPATTPYGGPVALVLASIVARRSTGREAVPLAQEALTRAEAMGAPWFAERARSLLSGGRRLDPLSPREGEVAELIVGGSTNREIADALFLSERTVEQHVRSILNKLQLPNRAAVAVWVARHG